ncbi:MAG: phage holin family protein [Actinomycetota bacterium]|nr:phage holin family protein [Actinomycetota bacterium]
MSYQAPQRDRDSQASIASAIQEITEKTQLLVKDEIELAKSELEVKVKALARGAAIGAAAGVFVLAALLMLMHGMAWLSYYFLPVNDLAFFWGFFFVAGLFLVGAAVAGYFAARFFKKGAPPTPQMAIDEGKRIQQTVNEARAAEVRR